MASDSKLFTPLSLGNVNLSHRVVMAPMTRNRGVPLAEGTTESPSRIWLADDLVAKYYAQRASPGGLLITEGIPPSLEAAGMPNVPGLFDPCQIPAWKKVVDEVHAKGGLIFAQLWHAGRATLPHFTGTPAVSASAIPWETDEKYPFRTPAKEKVAYRDFPPVALDKEGIERTVGYFVKAAKVAVEECGFDGVEINGGNGNLLDQFLHSNLNTRTDEYGGSPEKRCRFPLELLAAVTAAIGPGRTGIRMEPAGLYQGTRGEERVETWRYLCEQIRDTHSGEKKLGYVHFIEPRMDRVQNEKEKEGFYASWSLPEVSNKHFRDILKEADIACISAGGWGAENARKGVEEGWDALAFAKWFTSNPDLPERLKKGLPFAEADRSRFYGSWDGVRENGYTTYGTWEEEVAKRKAKEEAEKVEEKLDEGKA